MGVINLEDMKTVKQKHTGVFFDKRRNKWICNIKTQGKCRFLGYFLTFEEAVKARKQGEQKYHIPQKVARFNLEKQIIDLYKRGKSLKETGKTFKVTGSCVSDILKKYNIQRRNNSIATNDTYIIELYKTKTIQQIAKQLNLSHGTIRRRLTYHNIFIRPNKKYNIDETMFDKIDGEWKAYFLGLVYADGCIQKNHSLKISLKESDREILEELNCIIYKDDKLLGYIKPKSFKTKNGILCRPSGQYYLTINRKHICNQFKKLGCSEKKSLTLEFPNKNQVPLNLMNHFIRGYFDGDGSFVLPTTFSMISSHNFCLGLQDFLLNFLKIKSYYMKVDKVGRVQIYKKNDIKKIFHYMYRNATLFLARKKDKFPLKLIE